MLDAGVVAVMLTCAGVAALGAVITFFFTAETGGISLEEVDAKGGLALVPKLLAVEGKAGATGEAHAEGVVHAKAALAGGFQASSDW